MLAAHLEPRMAHELPDGNAASWVDLQQVVEDLHTAAGQPTRRLILATLINNHNIEANCEATDSKVTGSTATDSKVTISTTIDSRVTGSTTTDSKVTISTTTDSRVTGSTTTDSKVTGSTTKKVQLHNNRIVHQINVAESCIGIKKRHCFTEHPSSAGVRFAM